MADKAAQGYNIVGSIRLEDFEREISQNFTWSHFDGISALAPTYEPYETISLQPCDSIAGAVEHYKAAFIEYAQTVMGEDGYASIIKPSNFTLYWRHRPELREQDGKYKVWSRCLLSDKPVDAEYVQGIK